MGTVWVVELEISYPFDRRMKALYVYSKKEKAEEKAEKILEENSDLPYWDLDVDVDEYTIDE